MSYLDKMKLITEGWGNYIWKSETVELLAKTRAEICANCDEAKEMKVPITKGDTIEEIAMMKCGGCGCPLSGKVRAIASSCPKDKW